MRVVMRSLRLDPVERAEDLIDRRERVESLKGAVMDGAGRHAREDDQLRAGQVDRRMILQEPSLWSDLALLPLIGFALNGTSSVLYGSVPDLVSPARRQRAFGIFYTGTIGSGAIDRSLVSASSNCCASRLSSMIGTRRDQK